MNVFDIAVELAADSNLRMAARVAVAIFDAKQFEDRLHANPIASAIIKAIHEEDD